MPSVPALNLFEHPAAWRAADRNKASFTVELEKLNTAVAGRLRYNELREKAASVLARVHGRFLDVLTPMVDDATFDLIMSSEEVTRTDPETLPACDRGAASGRNRPGPRECVRNARGRRCAVCPYVAY